MSFYFAWLHVHYEQAFLAERELRLYGAVDKLGCAAVTVPRAEGVDKQRVPAAFLKIPIEKDVFFPLLRGALVDFGI